MEQITLFYILILSQIYFIHQFLLAAHENLPRCY